MLLILFSNSFCFREEGYSLHERHFKSKGIMAPKLRKDYILYMFNSFTRILTHASCDVITLPWLWTIDSVFSWAVLNDQKSGSELKVTYIIITSAVIFSLTCNYIPGARRKQGRHSDSLTLLLQSESMRCQFSAISATVFPAPTEHIYLQLASHPAALI